MPRNAELIYWYLDDMNMISGIFKCEGKIYRVTGLTTTELEGEVGEDA